MINIKINTSILIVLCSIIVLPFFEISQLASSTSSISTTFHDYRLIASNMNTGSGRPSGGVRTTGHPSGVRMSGQPVRMPPKGGSTLPGRKVFMPPYVIDYGSGGYIQPGVKYGPSGYPPEDDDWNDEEPPEGLINVGTTYQQLYYEMGMPSPTDNTTPTNPPPPTPPAPPPEEKKPPVIIIKQTPPEDADTTTNVTPTAPKVDKPPKKTTIDDCTNANHEVQFMLERRTAYKAKLAEYKSDLEAHRAELNKYLLAAQYSNSDKDWDIYRSTFEEYQHYSAFQLQEINIMEQVLQLTELNVQAVIAARDAICGY